MTRCRTASTAINAFWTREKVNQTNLGIMYRNGEGVPQDYGAAVSWCRKAADQGDAMSQNNLGVMYSRGQGVRQDYVQAHTWFNLAAARFPASETEERNKAVKNRDLLARKMTTAQIAEAQKLARAWKPPPRTFSFEEAKIPPKN